MQNFQERIIEVIENGIPGEKAHEQLLPIKILNDRNIKFQQKKIDHSYRDSAVSVLLYPHLNSIFCVLTERPKYEGKHSGQISFPGGKHENIDSNFESTARRETHEEIGFPLEKGTLLSPLTSLFIPVSNFLVHPYLFYTSERPDFIPDVREVQNIIEFDVFDLISPEILKIKDIQIKGGIRLKNIPYFHIQENIVWGATAMVLSELKMILEEL